MSADIHDLIENLPAVIAALEARIAELEAKAKETFGEMLKEKPVGDNANG